MKNLFIFLLFLTLATNLMAQGSKEVSFGSVILTENGVNEYKGGPYNAETVKNVIEGLNTFLTSKGYSFIGQDSKVNRINDIISDYTSTYYSYNFKNVEKKKTIKIFAVHTFNILKANSYSRAVDKVDRDDYTLTLSIKDSDTIKEADL